MLKLLDWNVIEPISAKQLFEDAAVLLRLCLKIKLHTLFLRAVGRSSNDPLLMLLTPFFERIICFRRVLKRSVQFVCAFSGS